MLDREALPTAEPWADLARLHRTALPGSLLSHLDNRTLARFYRFVAASPSEWLFIHEADGRVVGGCVLSLDSAGLQTRFIRLRPFAFARSALVALVSRKGFAAYLGNGVRGLLAPAPPAITGPEVTHIFVAPECRGRGIGAALLARTEQRLAALAENVYRVRTLAQDNEETLAFYRARGFAADRQATFFGHEFQILTKRLAGPAP